MIFQKQEPIYKLHGLLTKAKIPHELKTFQDRKQIYYPGTRQPTCTIIQWDTDCENLEMMGLFTDEEDSTDEMVIYLAPLEIYSRISAHWAMFEQ